MVADEPSLSFDHLSFFMDCAQVMATIQKNCNDRVRQLREASARKVGFLAYELVDEILWEAVLNEKGSLLAVRRQGMLREVAVYLKTCIMEDGGKWTTHARGIRTGSIPHVPEDMADFMRT